MNILVMMTNNPLGRLAKGAMLAIAAIAVLLTGTLVAPQPAQAYPVFAQQAYESPREATGRIVCANCHLAAKPTEVEVPQSVLPDTVFKAVVKVPYEDGLQQVVGDGNKGPMNVGAVLMLPEGFQLAPEDRIPEELQEEVGGLYYQPYSEDQQNVLVIGPIPGDQYREIVFPILSPDPKTDKSLRFGKYAVHAGGNRGRGQVYPNGAKSNNAVFNATAAGTVTAVAQTEDGGYSVTIQKEDGTSVTDMIPAGPDVIVSEGETVAAGAALTNDPNVGGFGQADTEIVLQSPDRIKWLLAFFALVMLTQIMLVLKKKQVERVQAAEMSF